MYIQGVETVFLRFFAIVSAIACNSKAQFYQYI